MRYLVILFASTLLAQDVRQPSNQWSDNGTTLSTTKTVSVGGTVLKGGGTSLPATCSVGNQFFLTTGTTGNYQCTAANTWTLPGGGVGPALPTAGLVARYSADSLAGADGDSVSAWPDLAGSNTLSASGSLRPYLRTTGSAGHKSVQFTPVTSTSGMVIPNTLTLTANSLSVFVVTRNNATPGSGIVSYVQLNNGLPLYYLEIGTREMQTRFLNSAVDIPTTMQVPTGIVLHGYSVSASEVRTYMNSRVLRTAANTAATALAGGAVGYRTDTSNAFMPAEYYEVLIYNHAFTSGEYEQLRQWAAATYGAGQRENRPLRILAQGNSLTSGYAPDGMLQRTWPERLGEIMAADVYNMGQGGQPTPTLSTNAPTVIDRLIQKNTKSVCILQEGTNHLLQGVSGATAYAAFVAWGTARKALGCYVVALTVPMYNGVGNTTPRTDLNSSIVASLVTDGGADLVIDIASDSRLAGGNSGLYRGTDSTHLTELGYSVVAELIAAGLYSKGF